MSGHTLFGHPLVAGKTYELEWSDNGRGIIVSEQTEPEKPRPGYPLVGSIVQGHGGALFRWNGVSWEAYEEKELLPYVNERIGEWVVRNEVPTTWTLPIVNGEPRPGLAQAGHDIIITVRRTA